MRRALIALVLVALTAAACGGPDDASTTTVSEGVSDSTTSPAPSEAVTTSTAGEASPANDEPSAAPLHVIATTSILGDIVESVGGDWVEVDVVMERGVDPHDFEPSAAQAARLREADVIVANGLGLEGTLTTMIEAAASDGTPVVELGAFIDPIPFGGHADDDHAHEGDDHGHDDDHAHEGEDDHGDEAADHGHDHGDEDPHFWQDPVRMADAVHHLGEELAGLDPAGHGEAWETRADAYAAEILAVHATSEDLLAAVPEDRRKMVTNHEAFGYFAARYDFTIVATVIPGGGTLAEPSAAEFARLISDVRDQQVPAVFVENTDPGVLADVLAGELDGVEIAELVSDSLTEPGTEAGTYLGLLATNAAIVAGALS